MIKLAPTLVVAVFTLAACGDGKSAPPAPTASTGPATYADVLGDPAGHVGAPVEFKVSLVVGEARLPSGEIARASEQSWEDPPGTPHSIAPVKPEANASAEACIFVVMNNDRTPLFPVQPILVDNMSPCLAGSELPVLTGKVQGVRNTGLTVDGRPATVKALVLSDPNFKAPF